MANTKTLCLQDVDTEEAILGLALMKKDEVLDLIVERLTENDFTMAENRMVFNAIREMFIEGQTGFNEITVEQRLQEKGQAQSVGGKVRLTSLQSKVPFPVPCRDEVDIYINILKDKTLRRDMFETGAKLQNAANALEISPIDGISCAEKSLMDLSNNNNDKVVDTATAMENAYTYLMNMYNGRPPEGAIKTGIGSVDQILTSINPTDFVVIGGRPAMGKTAFAGNILENVALKQGKYVALFSLEMSSNQIGARMILSLSGISSESIRRGELTESDIICLEEAMKKLKAASFFIDDRAPLDLATIITRSRKLKVEKNVGLIMIDYLQLMNSGTKRSDGRQQEVSEISRSLKMLAKELEVPIIALSQLNRSLESRNDKRPQMSDLRESGSIEQDADIIMFLYRDDYYNPKTEDQGITEVIVAKHRNGPTGTAKMYFSKDTTHFYDLSTEYTGEQKKEEEQEPDCQKELFDDDKENDGDIKEQSKIDNKKFADKKTEKADSEHPTISGPPVFNEFSTVDCNEEEYHQPSCLQDDDGILL